MDVLIYFLYGLLGVFLLCAMYAAHLKDRDGEPKSQPDKPTSKATVKAQAPTEEELLLAMSDTELLRELVRLQRMSLRSQQSQTRVSRLGIFGFLALLSGGE